MRTLPFLFTFTYVIMSLLLFSGINPNSGENINAKILGKRSYLAFFSYPNTILIESQELSQDINQPKSYDAILEINPFLIQNLFSLSKFKILPKFFPSRKNEMIFHENRDTRTDDISAK